jgi:rod shape determining protein RodA
VQFTFKKNDTIIVILMSFLVLAGTAVLYAAADGNFDPWAKKHIFRYCVGLFVMTAIASSSPRLWYNLAYPIYLGTFILLVIVELFGETNKGAERWIDIGFMQLQPSELMKVAIVLALARFFHDALYFKLPWWVKITVPSILIALPVIMVLKQPDLGTALLIAFNGIALMFLSGISWWFFGSGIATVLIAFPIIWANMKTYQKNRVFTFLDPESDPLGKGYHIMQSKIAIGSGGATGRGYMQGTQSMLEFLPEKHTDFAFTSFAEQFGFIGFLVLISLFMALIARIFYLSLQQVSTFSRMIIMGMGINFFLYVFINMAMVMGLIPVVGVPLPFMSFGGTSMISIIISFGLLMCVIDCKDPRRSNRDY